MPVARPTPELIAALAPIFAEAMPAISSVVPAAPAAELGRIAASSWPDEQPRRSGPLLPDGRPSVDGFNTVSVSLTEQLLDALQPHVPILRLDAVKDLLAEQLRTMTSPDLGPFMFGQQIRPHSAPFVAVARLQTDQPGTTEMAYTLAAALAAHPTVAALLTVPNGTVERSASRLGAAYLALAVVAAAAVLRELDRFEAVTMVGVALACAAVLLGTVARSATVQDQSYAEHRDLGAASGNVDAPDHRFGLVHGPFPESTDFSVNGLVTPVPGGVMIWSGQDPNPHVSLASYAQAPLGDTDLSWDDVVEISWTAPASSIALTGPSRPMGESFGRAETPPSPGEYRLRVHATGRDGADRESYKLELWPAPEGPPVVYKSHGPPGLSATWRKPATDR